MSQPKISSPMLTATEVARLLSLHVNTVTGDIARRIFTASLPGTQVKAGKSCCELLRVSDHR
jgi:hypothetical protein